MTGASIPQRTRAPGILAGERWIRIPWWAILLVVTGLVLLFLILANPDYNATFDFLSAGVVVTLRITLVSYVISLVIGLIVGIGRTSQRVLIYNASTLYVETVRGIPLIVLLLYFAYIIVPAGVTLVQALGNFGVGLGISGLQGMAKLNIRQVNIEVRAIVAFGVAYGAYEAEVFRAGIQSIGRGQVEAARSLGMNYYQVMRFVILPQAIRRVLPPLGNDFIALLKDSSLATVLAVNELTQLSRLRRASTFRVNETFNVTAFLYLAMTLALSMAVRSLERRMHIEE